MLETNPTLEEALAKAEVFGFDIGEFVVVNGQKIKIAKMSLADEDWPTLEMFLSLKGRSLNLIFTVMVYHFPQKFNYENLKIFMQSAGEKAKEMAKNISIRLNIDGEAMEKQEFLGELKAEIAGKTIAV